MYILNNKFFTYILCKQGYTVPIQRQDKVLRKAVLSNPIDFQSQWKFCLQFLYHASADTLLVSHSSREVP